MVYCTCCRIFRNICWFNKDFSILYAFLLFVVLRHMYSANVNSAFISTQEVNDSISINRNESFHDYEQIILSKAKEISLRRRTVLLSVVNNAYLSLAYSWLCNTLYMGVHDSMLVITTDSLSKNRLTKDWPLLNVINLDLDIPQNDQFYSHVGYIKLMVLRTKVIVSILKTDIDIMLIEFDFVWFTNPVPHLSKIIGYDMLLQPVSNSKGKLVCGGFMYLFATNRSTMVFKKLSDMMSQLEDNLKNEDNFKKVSMRKNDQEYISNLVIDRYGGLSVYFLPQDKYADGKWYKLNEKERKATQPFVLHNNFIIGNRNKIKRARQWKHWFLRSDEKCNSELVNMTTFQSNV